MADLYQIFRQACAALSRRNKREVRVYCHDAAGVPSVNFLEPGAKDVEIESEDYSTVQPAWLRPVDGKVKLDVAVYGGNGTEYVDVVLDERGAWKDDACTQPLFLRAASKGSLRDQAVVKLGEARVLETERIINETVTQLLGSKLLAKNGILRGRSKPTITFRWARGKSRGGRKGLSFAVLEHASKPDLKLVGGE